MERKNVAIIGQGRSGKNIHGRYLLSEKNEFFRVRYVVERDEFRRERAKELYEGCEVLSDYTELFDKKDVDLVVNASYSDEHYPISLELLKRGFNVLSEKPAGRNQFECDNLILEAEKQQVFFNVFQNTMYSPHVVKALETAASGLLGEIREVKIRYSGFARRWDWQTLQKRMGGNAYNTGPHPIGIALGFLDFDRDSRVIYSKLATTEMSSGDADDFCKILLTAPGKPLVDIEINSDDAFSDYNIRILGDRGTYQTTIGAYKMKYLIPGENPEQPLQEASLRDEQGEPIYCGEKLIAHEEAGEIEGDAFSVGADRIYRGVYAWITEGKKLPYSAEDFALIYRVIETAHAENPLNRKF